MDKYTLIAVAAIIGAVLIGCDEKKTTTDTRTPGQKVQSAGDKTGDAVQKGIDSASRGLGNAVDKTRDAARTAADRTSDRTTDAAENARLRVQNAPAPTTQPVVVPSPTR
jgi:hypothetical protein